MHRLIADVLNRPKIRFYHAFSGEEVYHTLMSIEINCIFMDFIMPHSSGGKVTDIIRKAYKNKKIYIIGMTGTIGGMRRKCVFNVEWMHF